MEIVKNFKKWYKEVDPFELIAIIFIIIGIIAIILVFLTSSFHEFFDTTKHDITHYAELIGGFVGSLWALAGVLLFYASLASQKSELEEQRNLLVKQIDEVVKQTQEFSKQSDIQAKQQYENTYFQLLRFHNEIITSIVLEITDVDFMSGTNTIRQINGRKSFVEYYDIYKRFFNTQLEILMTGELTIPIIQRIVDNSYRQFFDEYQADLGHYFRNLYNVLYFIDNLEDEEKSKFYLELLHAQLSNYELALLYFHCASSNNSEFKILLEKYELLATIPDDEIISMSKRLYNPKAFGKEDFDSDDDMNFGGGDSSNSDFNIEENSFNLNDADLSFSENDILSKFASLSKKQKHDTIDDFANLDFSGSYNDDFNFNFDDINDSKDFVDKKSFETHDKTNKDDYNLNDISLDKLRHNFDKQNENKSLINQDHLDKIKESHSNDNLLGDLATKLKKQMANKSQDDEDDIWGFDDYVVDNNSIKENFKDNEDLNNNLNESEINNNKLNQNELNNKSENDLMNKLKKFQSKNEDDLSDINEIEFDTDLKIDNIKNEFSDKINLLDKLKKISDFDNTINSQFNNDFNNNILEVNKETVNEVKLEDLEFNDFEIDLESGYDNNFGDNFDKIDNNIDLNEEDNIDSIKAKLNKKKPNINLNNENLGFKNKVLNELSEEGISVFELEDTNLTTEQNIMKNLSYDKFDSESKPISLNKNLDKNIDKSTVKSIEKAENKKMDNLAKLIQKRR